MSFVFFPKDPRSALMGPSPAQRRAGNYAKPKLKFQGLDISIENPRGSLRTGTDPDGKEWSTGMQHHYGYIRGTLGVDGDHVDCYVGPNKAATHAFVITTMMPPEFADPDEQKAMLGFDHENEAREAFAQHYDDPRHFGSCIAMPMDEFRQKVRQTRENPAMIKGIVLFCKAAADHGKLSQRVRGQIGTVGSYKREEMPTDVFLLPDERKYPVKVKVGHEWTYSSKLLGAAIKEAKMHGRADVAKRAEELLARA